MKFLLDEMLSPAIAERLRRAGHDAVSVLEVGLCATDDAVICDYARADQRVMVTENFADFARERELTLLFIRPSRFSAAPAISTAILDWVRGHPSPYPGVHWLALSAQRPRSRWEMSTRWARRQSTCSGSPRGDRPDRSR